MIICLQSINTRVTIIYKQEGISPKKQNMEKQNGNKMKGGKRKGAGRPLGTKNRKKISATLPMELVEWLRKQDLSQAKVIEKALNAWRKSRR